jgi:hypothetical protein
MLENDEIFFGTSKNGREIGLRSLHDLVDISINNDFSRLSDLHAHINNLNLLDPQHLRPSWDTYFMVMSFQGEMHDLKNDISDLSILGFATIKLHETSRWCRSSPG